MKELIDSWGNLGEFSIKIVRLIIERRINRSSERIAWKSIGNNPWKKCVGMVEWVTGITYETLEEFLWRNSWRKACDEFLKGLIWKRSEELLEISTYEILEKFLYGVRKIPKRFFFFKNCGKKLLTTAVGIFESCARVTKNGHVIMDRT